MGRRWRQVKIPPRIEGKPRRRVSNANNYAIFGPREHSIPAHSLDSAEKVRIAVKDIAETRISAQSHSLNSRGCGKGASQDRNFKSLFSAHVPCQWPCRLDEVRLSLGIFDIPLARVLNDCWTLRALRLHLGTLCRMFSESDGGGYA